MRTALIHLVFLASIIGSLFSGHIFAAAPEPAPIAWVKWSDDAFARAKKENKFVLLDLHAVWCHWCHVMDDTTYSDPKVRQLMADHYIAVGVDQDSRPDLASRYEDYGWPATIVFGSDRKEIVKRRGYIPSAAMASMLQAIVDDPTPGPSVQADAPVVAASQPRLSTAVRDAMEKKLFTAYDDKQGAWGSGQKYLNWDNTEYCLDRASDPRFSQMARQTLTEQLHLLDPAWGGVYQYSTDDDWVHPHFEKIMQMQAENLRIYAMAYDRFGDAEDLHAAMAIRNFLENFLNAPNGGFYTSQDADLIPGEHSASYFAMDNAGRRKLGVPKVDQHEYARENGWAIAALCELNRGALNQDLTTTTDAITAANWVIANRSLPGGGFRHGEADGSGSDPGGPYLGDTLAMGQAFLGLYTATADIAWLDRAGAAADFINQNFLLLVGVAASKPLLGATFAPLPEVDENIGVARFANLLFHYTGNKAHRSLAEHAMQFIASPQVAEARGYAVGGILLADRELGSDPLHLAVVGSPADPRTQALLAEGREYFNAYKRLDLVDPNAVRLLPDSDVQYPVLKQPAAFLCTAGACSAPVTDPQKLKALLARRGR